MVYFFSVDMLIEQTEQKIRPRGTQVMLPTGGLPEVIPPYLQELIAKTGGAKGPIGLQFVARPDLEKEHFAGEASDPLDEDKYLVAPGLVYKYKAEFKPDGRIHKRARALWTITFTYAAYCPFCTRGRQLSVPSGYKSDEQAEPHS